MLAVLSPAKSLDFASPLATRANSQPRLLDHSAALIDEMVTRSPADIAALMHISDDLAHLNATRYAQWSKQHTPATARQAVLAFNGDVYQGLGAASFGARDFTEAQKTLRILSGLYGLLRPLDLIQPHRLEMGTRLTTERGASLYDWWGGLVTDLLLEDLAASPGAPVLVNLASGEYAKVLRLDAVTANVITPRFEDLDSKGNPRVVSFYAKRARGAMAAWLVRHRVRSAGKIADFTADGYRLDEARSTKEHPIFTR